MARIQVLPDSIASKIAAGEVVERPASALKELVENSLDAGARAVEVSIQSGGRDAITVVDDGDGMGPDDLLLALERHATSKIHSDADIEHVSTLGFRGEAVPSIASVSRFRLSSRDSGSEVATVVEVHGGKLLSVSNEPAPRGTKVEVASLFFNAPARRKFLRSAETEKQRCAEFLSRLALAYPHVRFRFSADGRTIFDHAPVGSPYERCAQVLGRQFTERLLPVDAREGQLVLAGLVSGLGETRSHTRDQHLFVNRRPVRDKLLSHAVTSAYWEALPRGRHPVVVLLLSLPADLVDVNVHPTKAEVRFRRGSEVHGFLLGAIRRVLREAGVEPGIAPGPAFPGGSAHGESLPGAIRPTGDAPGSAPGLASRAVEGGSEVGPGPRRFGEPALPDWGGLVWAPSRTRAGSRGRAEPGEGPGEGWRFTPGTGSLEPAAATGRPARAALTPLGQFLDSYIVASEGEELLLVDQHAAHERILFEKIRGRAGEVPPEARAPAQRLLTPVTIELGALEAAGVGQRIAVLGAIGFELEPFGERTLLLRALPAALASQDPERLVREVLSDLREGTTPAAPAEQARRAAASAACHAAIKVRFPLTTEKMAWLLEELLRCETPTSCPHGRPAILRLGREAIEKGFHRR